MANTDECNSNQSRVSLREECKPNHDHVSTHRHERDQDRVLVLKHVAPQTRVHAQQEARKACFSAQQHEARIQV